jgi:hypothetical protein
MEICAGFDDKGIIDRQIGWQRAEIIGRLPSPSSILEVLTFGSENRPNCWPVAANARRDAVVS